MEVIAPMPSQRVRRNQPLSDEESHGSSEGASVEVQLEKWQDAAPRILNPVVASLEVEKRDYYKRQSLREQREDYDSSILESEDEESEEENERIAPMVLCRKIESLELEEEEHHHSKSKKNRTRKKDVGVEEREGPRKKHGYSKSDLRLVEDGVLPPRGRPTSAKSLPIKQRKKKETQNPMKQPSSTKTFPSSKNKATKQQEGRRYPDEKWVPPSLGLVRAESNASSVDPLLNNYAKFGKYDVDRTSLIQPLKLESDAERYGASSPPLVALSNSFDSGAPEWRSEDEDDDGPDWDMSMVSSKGRSAKVSKKEDDGTTSMDMNSYDGTKVQVLTDKHRFDSLLDKDPMPSDEEKNLSSSSSIKRWMKTSKKSKTGKSSKKGKKKKGKQGSKKSKAKKNALVQSGSGSSLGEYQAPDQGSKRSLSFLRTQPLMRDIPSRTKTMSTMSNSVPFSLKEDEKSRSRQRDVAASSSAESESGEDDKYSEYGVENEDGCGEDDLSACSSGSLSTRAQMEFRRKKREEHLRWLKKRRRERSKGNWKDLEPLDSDDWDDYNSEDRAKASKAKSSMKGSDIMAPNREQKGGFLGLFKRKNKRDKNQNEETISKALPWEEKDKSQKKGLLHRVAATLLPKKDKVNSVEDLPFPASDSMDGSLAELDRDRYHEILDQLPTLTPASYDIAKDGSTGSVSSISHSFPRRKASKLQSKRGMILF